MLDPFIQYFHDAEKPFDQAKYGFELEVVGFNRSTLKRVEYSQLNKILNEFKRLSRWKEVEEGGNLTELSRGPEKISLEPGGQFEYSAPPLSSVSEVRKHLLEFKETLRQISQNMDLIWLSVGYDPFHSLEEIPWMPKKRYEVMRAMLKPLGSKTHNMMLGTCGSQISVDFHSEEDMRKKLVVSQALAPIFTLLFANSPVVEKRLSGYQSFRQQTWNDFDPSRSGIIFESFKEDFSYRDYVEHLFKVPMLVIGRGNSLIDCRSKDFETFIKEGIDEYQYEFDDWKSHLRSVFYFSRLKNVIEFRTVDSSNLEMLVAFTSLCCGFIYNPNVLDKAYEYALRVGPQTIKEFCDKVCKDGFKTAGKNLSLIEYTETLLDMYEGCKRFAAEPLPKCPQTGAIIEMFEKRQNLASLIEKEIKGSPTKNLLEIYESLNLVFA